MKIKKWIRPTLFTLGGALAGLAYYHFIGCASGSCPITSSPLGSMLYMGVIGLFGNNKVYPHVKDNFRGASAKAGGSVVK